jgi:hypothetical protein
MTICSSNEKSQLSLSMGLFRITLLGGRGVITAKEKRIFLNSPIYSDLM